MAHILLIEDDDTLREAVSQNLARAGHTVIEAADGDQGLALFRTNQVDLVLTDLVMPGKEGIQTIIEIRREQPELPIVAMSGGLPRSGTYLGIAGKLGARYVLAKPFTPQELLAAINQSLAPRPPRPL